MTEQLAQEQIDEYSDAFTLFDTNGDGTVTAEELRTVMKSLGQDLSEKEIANLIKEVDSNGDGSVELPEFLKLMANLERDAESVERKKHTDAFKQFDKDGSGTISVDELKQIMDSLGVHISIDEAKQMLKEADVDSDGVVNMEEYIRIMKMVS
eukprot:TRINITY_DN18147_c0_g1_i1.p1 TRINITY_DN18147_c0_g1~~TRINITY_DN18147_c0_g1_i1.p1  ORF type:complete len:153 (-),score=47.27 TRINITY_DN18147_c0_g1_i1:40-498(-)